MSQEHFVSSIIEGYETTCWGCGLHVLLQAYSPVFKCGYCGAITNENAGKCDNKIFWWRRLRDRFFLCVIYVFMLFILGGGIWAVYPVVFSISNFCGIFHLIITIILAVATISSFSIAAFRCAGAPPSLSWGSCPPVVKGGLENYTFCHFCSKPKSPRTHHCRSCRMCILDMDHHCPFIGNCVGAANHRYFIIFLISTITSTFYASIMCVFAGTYMWPPLKYGSLSHTNTHTTVSALKLMKEVIIAFLRSAVFLSTRGLVLVYLFVASVSVSTGLCLLLWQQLCYIYAGKTYLSHLQGDDGDGVGERDCGNIVRFFGCTYSRYLLPTFRRTRKRHET